MPRKITEVRLFYWLNLGLLLKKYEQCVTLKLPRGWQVGNIRKVLKLSQKKATRCITTLCVVKLRGRKPLFLWI